jgi:hypothetical protein
MIIGQHVDYPTLLQIFVAIMPKVGHLSKAISLSREKKELPNPC